MHPRIRQGQLLITVGGIGTAVVAWDGLERDEVLDGIEGALDFLEGTPNDCWTREGLRTGQPVRLRYFAAGKPDLADLDMD